MPGPAGVLHKPVVLVVEGKDDERFFSAFVKHLGLEDRIQVVESKGRENLPAVLRTVKTQPGFGQVRHLVIIRDADDDPDAAFQSVQSALKSAQLPLPRRLLEPTSGTPPLVTVIILPDGNRPGMLEDLCLQSVTSDPALPCVESYFECLRAQGLSLPKQLSKARVHVFLASRETPDLRLGEAAEAGYWLWDAEAFKGIRQFLLSI